MNCINAKQTNKSKRGAKRNTNLLEIIRTDICCPNMDSNGPKHFITVIDDYSRYMYLYLLHCKDEALGTFITWCICEVSSRKWDCWPVYYAWFSRSKWRGRKKKSNFNGHGKEYEE